MQHSVITFFRKKRRTAAFLLAAVVTGVVVLALYFFYSETFANRTLAKQYLTRLSEESYESVLLSMHSAESFLEEDFAYFRGLDTMVVNSPVSDTKQLSVYLNQILNSNRTISHLFLCLDPELLRSEAKEKEALWAKKLQESLYDYIESHPETTFEILLPSPYIDYWLAYRKEDLQALLEGAYHDFVNEVCAYPNAKVYFPGSEYWLMVNPENYSDPPFGVNEVLAQQLIRSAFCDGAYQITPLNEEEFWSRLRETIENEQNSPTYYPDLSDWRLVLFGDSVLAHGSKNLSISGYISGLSGACVSNYSVGGTSAALNFPLAADSFLAENVSPAEQRRLCFLINYGFNDYFNGVPIDNASDPMDVSSYKGSLRSSIRKLQDTYPEAPIILMTPTHTSLFEYGTLPLSENGDTLSDYVEATREIADEMELYYMDNYHDFVVTQETIPEYLGDGCHPNEKGRLAIAARIINFIEDECSDPHRSK